MIYERSNDAEVHAFHTPKSLFYDVNAHTINGKYLEEGRYFSARVAEETREKRTQYHREKKTQFCVRNVHGYIRKLIHSRIQKTSKKVNQMSTITKIEQGRGPYSSALSILTMCSLYRQREGKLTTFRAYDKILTHSRLQ